MAEIHGTSSEKFIALREALAKNLDRGASLGLRRSSQSTVRRECWGLLLEELYSFVGEGWEQEDDITLLTLGRSTASR
jgi:hypothetical protein